MKDEDKKKKKKEEEANALKKLGENIEKRFKKKYKTKGDFAIVAECSPEYLGRVMKGQKNPSYIRIIKIADALDTTVDELRN